LIKSNVSRAVVVVVERPDKVMILRSFWGSL